MLRPSIFLLTGLLLSCALAGCEKGPPPGPNLAKPYLVQGQITFPNGSPLRGGMIHFKPLQVKDGSKIRFEGDGLVDTKGMYKLGFAGDGNGVPAGEYKVTIMPRDYMELRGSNSASIPQSYRDKDTTPLTVTVEEKENTFNFVLK